MAIGLLRAVIATVVASGLAGVPLAGATVPVRAQAFDARAAARTAVAHVIGMGGERASLVTDNATRLILNNPGYARDIVLALVEAAGDPSTPAGVAEALGRGLGVALVLVDGTDLRDALDRALVAALREGGRGVSPALAAFQAGLAAAQLAARNGTLPKVAGLPTAATLDAVLAQFAGGLPVNETGTISRN